AGRSGATRRRHCEVGFGARSNADEASSFAKGGSRQQLGCAVSTKGVVSRQCVMALGIRGCYPAGRDSK
ncbi:MAG: hypothetical protein N2035_10475, partial [Chthoniobacterales bacterium]|nr:hypothetical protein [Chthoniobacterales bacterium]